MPPHIGRERPSGVAAMVVLTFPWSHPMLRIVDIWKDATHHA